jgi:hypothetical protein
MEAEHQKELKQQLICVATTAYVKTDDALA